MRLARRLAEVRHCQGAPRSQTCGLPGPAAGCVRATLLAAAHSRSAEHDTGNGLLLRADLHTLNNLHLLGVDEFDNVVLSCEVADPYYKQLVASARRINPPDKSEDRPSEDDRRARTQLFSR